MSRETQPGAEHAEHFRPQRPLKRVVLFLQRQHRQGELLLFRVEFRQVRAQAAGRFRGVDDREDRPGGSGAEPGEADTDSHQDGRERGTGGDQRTHAADTSEVAEPTGGVRGFGAGVVERFGVPVEFGRVFVYRPGCAVNLPAELVKCGGRVTVGRDDLENELFEVRRHQLVIFCATSSIAAWTLRRISGACVWTASLKNPDRIPFVWYTQSQSRRGMPRSANTGWRMIPAFRRVTCRSRVLPRTRM